MTNNITGKVVVITGASGGLGEAIARHLVKLDAKVVLGARRIERLEKLVSEIKSEKGNAVAAATDVTKRQDLERLASKAVEQFGRVDVLVNNAGIMQLASLAKLRVDEWDRMIDVNIKGVLYGIAAVLPLMNKQQSGHIINIASVAGLKVFGPIGTVYSATKFAVRALSEGLRAEAGANIRTTIISPGAIESELQEGSTDPEAQEVVGEFYRANQIPADSIARAVAYAMEQPIDVDINEIVIRPTAQEF